MQGRGLRSPSAPAFSVVNTRIFRAMCAGVIEGRPRYYPAEFSHLVCAALRDCSAGKGCVYSFDPVGSYERELMRAGGSASTLLQPLLDNQARTHAAYRCQARLRARCCRECNLLCWRARIRAGMLSA